MGLLGKIGSGVTATVRGTATGIYRVGVWTANRRRWLLRSRLPDYVVIELARPLSERDPAEPWWFAYIPGRESGQSLEALDRALKKVAGDPAVRGVILHVRGPVVSLAQAQSVVLLFERFRSQNQPATAKSLVVHLEQTTLATYVMACAADKIVLAPLASWDVLGLRTAPTFLKDTLARFGVEFNVVKIAPWKTAADGLSRASMSAEQREQLTWLLDDLYQQAVTAISQGRGLPRARVAALIDNAPLTAEEARAADLVDWIAYEDELPRLLSHTADEDADEDAEPATLKRYDAVEKLLLRHARPRRRGAIGVLSLEGAIVPGTSRRSPLPLPILGERTIGSTTAQQQIRAARADDGLAAVIVHVDSPGGSALASDLIWRELALLDQAKPVIIYMGDVAASGGYYIAAPGRKIVAQPATLTGSIGVIVAKPVVADAYVKADARKEVIQRGQNAGLYAADVGWDAAQFAKVEEGVRHVYAKFKQRVAEGRQLDFNDLDDVSNGRVWTGAQALSLGLIDATGDFADAVRAACEQADLPTDGSVELRTIAAPGQSLLAAPAEAVRTMLGLDAAAEAGQWLDMLLHGKALDAFPRDPLWLWADGLPRVR